MKDLVTIEANAYWACLGHKNSMSKKYQVDLGELSDEAIEELRELEDPSAEGFSIKNKDDERGFFLTCQSNFPIGISKKNQEEGLGAETIPGMKGSLLGNGSRVRVEVGRYFTEYKKQRYNKPMIKRIVVLDYKAPPSKDDPFYDGVDRED